MKRVLITGATGFLGRRLVDRLQETGGYQLSVLSHRSPLPDLPKVEMHAWSELQGLRPPDWFENLDIIVHLAGANIGAKRWTRRRKLVMEESRVLTARCLVEAIEGLSADKRPELFLSASAVGYYGLHSPLSHICVEADPPGVDFLGQLVARWEAELLPLEEMHVRRVCLRLGPVLSPEAKFLQVLRGPLRAGLGLVLGSGRQYVSWIHIKDVLSLMIGAIEGLYLKQHKRYNVVAPEPVTQREFVLLLSEKLREKTRMLSVPERLLRLALGEMSELMIRGSRVSCHRVLEEGYVFKYASLSRALDHLLQTSPKEHDTKSLV